MFEQKKTSLFNRSTTASVTTSSAGTMVSNNPFVQTGLKESSKTTNLGNGAQKLTTSGSDFVDQFGKATNYKNPRSYAEISKDMSILFGQNKLLALSLTFYLRMITRVTSLFNGSKTTTSQRGQGLKHEGIFRMIWVALNAPDTFWKNIALFISVGSWKDIIMMLSYDLQYNGWKDRKLDWDKFGKLILAGLENPNTSELVKKYLPQIKSNSQCKTIEAQADNMIAKWICSLLFEPKGEETGSTYKKYRKLKTSGTAHEWQQLISQGKFLEINFDTIHGRALAQLVSGKFLSNHQLEGKYEDWCASKPVVKFTGYVYELFEKLGTGNRVTTPLKTYQIDTINKQFKQLVDTAKIGMIAGENGFIPVIDTSGSMMSCTPGTKASAYVIAKSMALYFSHLLGGRFEKAYLEFSNETIMKVWKGETPYEQYVNENSARVENTNFLSVADHFGKILKEGVPESEFPTGIICMTDGCFDPTYIYGMKGDGNQRNFTALLNRLRNFGFSEEFVSNFKVVLWDVPNSHYGPSQTAFEEFANYPNLFHISGLDGAAIAFLTGVEGKPKTEPKTSDELFLAAMDQEVLNLLEV